ncbi:HCNGP-like protein-domain-containing protein [Mycotypha africana]|uniref:HCNGP-like protein-domain-containing protein n=1 Tax=Mycotypha africana TaxID=64632 RepID=UPI0023004D2D|nr:HCNGP-like protein-domain-containing protein [Mycotypha africana]KAI8979671.1 HCNGP-like protein-domain-containing protein [Mycotypha africana]
MNPLSGLVNYSDDENSSSTSSDDEQQGIIQSATTEDLPRSVESKDKTASAPQRIESRVGDHNRRLIAAIAPKPIEGVDNWGIPDETTEPCSPGRVERIAHFLSLKASGHRLNHHLQRNKAFHNPRIYTKLVEFTEVDEIGSNFDKNDYDPHGFPKEMYIDGILETQKNLAEEKAMQQQNRTSVNFVPPQQQQPAKATTNLTEQQSAAMAQAMEAAARVASRIAKPPPVSTLPTAAVTPEKRRSKWDDTGRRDKRG